MKLRIFGLLSVFVLIALMVTALALLIGITFLATRMGGEFLPKLGEGAIVGTTVRLAGVSVEEAVAYNDRIEKLLLAEFPDEITNIWTRLGSAEIATDRSGRGGAGIGGPDQRAGFEDRIRAGQDRRHKRFVR